MADRDERQKTNRFTGWFIAIMAASGAIGLVSGIAIARLALTGSAW